MSREFLEKELAETRSIVDAAVQMSDPRVSAVMKDISCAGGKFLRPRILVLSAMAGKYDPVRIRPLAAAVEILHTATLVHDDVIDDSPSRRGQPSAHVRVGRKDAVLAGDYLLSRSMMLAVEQTSPENSRLLARAINVIVSAEIVQDSARWSFSPSIRACLRKIGGKTAALFALAAAAGAGEAKVPLRLSSALARAAWAAGVAFQIQDDILDWDGTEAELGKTVMNDLAEGLCTLPLAFALGVCPEELAPFLTPEAVAGGSAERVARLVHESGGLTRARALADTYRDRSLESLEGLPESFHRTELASVFTSFVGRRK